MGELKDASFPGLLALRSEILEELRRRGVARSANSPTGSLAEFLFCRTFAWEQAPNSEKVCTPTPPPTRNTTQAFAHASQNGALAAQVIVAEVVQTPGDLRAGDRAPRPRYALGSKPGSARTARAWNVIVPLDVAGRGFQEL